MKTHKASLNVLSVLVLATSLLEPGVTAQDAATLGIRSYPGLSITGSVGSVYSIEFTSDLAGSGEEDWRCLELLTLPVASYVWTDLSDAGTEKRFYRTVRYVAPEGMVLIPRGTFMMGIPPGEVPPSRRERYRQTAVTLTRGFWMGKYEVTQGEFETVMGYNPSTFVGRPDLPVETVSWEQAMAYCEELTQVDRAAGRIPATCRYRLPTEAEREYACRAGTTTRFSHGDDPDYLRLGDYAWYEDNTELWGLTTQAVGQKLPNPWGLYDMHGNVFEWCHDWWTDALPGGSVIDPQGPLEGSKHTVRGGGWRHESESRGLRSGGRGFPVPASGSRFGGFRVVLGPELP